MILVNRASGTVAPLDPELLMDVLLDALGYQARQPHQEDVSTSSTDAHKELLADIVHAIAVAQYRSPIPASWGVDSDGVTGRVGGAAVLPAAERLDEIPRTRAGISVHPLD